MEMNGIVELLKRNEEFYSLRMRKNLLARK